MVAVAWAAIGLLAVALGIFAAAFFQVSGRIDRLGARLDGRIDAVNTRLDTLTGRMDVHLESHTS